MRKEIEREPTALEMLHAAPKRKIVIHKSDKPGDQPYAYVGVNGIGYQIEKGAEVEVPEPVVRVLQNAKQTTYGQATNPVTKESIIVPREVYTYPFSLV